MDLHCSFSELTFYTCFLSKLSFNGSTSARVVGKHSTGKSNQSVEHLIVNIGRFPRGLGAIFPKTVHLTVCKCGIENISTKDFMDFGNLERLDLGDNRIVEIPVDAFEGLKHLKDLFLHRNLIRSIHPKAFDACPKLNWLYLRGNPAIDADWNHLSNDANRKTQMMMEIVLKCNPLELRLEIVESLVHQLSKASPTTDRKIESRLDLLETKCRKLELQQMMSKAKDEQIESLVSANKLLGVRLDVVEKLLIHQSKYYGKLEKLSADMTQKF